MRKTFGIIVLIIILLNTCAAFAATEADSVFSWTSATLTTQKKLSFSLRTIQVCDEIRIDSCVLQKKVGGDWAYDATLTPPSYVAENKAQYVTTVNYSAQIGSGTYRIIYQANADGHTVTRYSTSRTF